MAKDPKVIKVSEVSAENMSLSARKSSDGQRKATSNGDNCWAQTCLWMHGLKDLDTYDATQEVKNIAEDLRKVFKDAFVEEYPEIPKSGKNARTGATMELLDGKGELKWSSWEGTRLPIGYMGDIARVIKADLVGDLIVSETSVLGKSDILKKAKVAEPPMKTCERSLEMIEKKLEALSVPELDILLTKLTDMKIATIDRKKAVEDAIKV